MYDFHKALYLNLLLQSAALYSSRKANNYPYSVPAGGTTEAPYNTQYTANNFSC